jgi:hypothetical protein
MTEKKVKKEPEHRDCLGRLLKVGDCVAAAHQNGLMIATIKKLHPKMIKVKKVGSVSSKWNTGEYNKYASECAILEGPEVTMFLLRSNTAS